MGRKIQKTAVFLVLLGVFTLRGWAAQLVPVGRVVGLEITGGGVHVAQFQEGLSDRARDAGIQIGDRLVRINDTDIHTVQDVQDALNRANGQVRLTVSRAGEELTVQMAPVITEKGPRLGLFIREGLAGVGTVTWFDPQTMRFGALGHGIHGSDGSAIDCKSGRVYRATVAAVKAGKAGQPGQLRGAVTGTAVLGTIEKNTQQGVFGTVTAAWEGEAVETATWDQVHTGQAQIRSNVRGDRVETFQVEILKLYTPDNNRSFLLKVTDPELLDCTGGIVQGMSGSPIIQDGKLVGAVTHVLVNDPTTGYGIFIENMLEAAG